MKIFFLVVHIVISIGLIGLILLQNSKGGLSSGVGGSEPYRSRRGAERLVFYATVALSVGFLLTSVINLLVK